jgi:hypothetical protein
VLARRITAPSIPASSTSVSTGRSYARIFNKEGELNPVEIHPATLPDLPAMLELSASKREQYEAYQPIFHRRAPDATVAQQPYLQSLIERDDVVSLVAMKGEVVVGFGTAEIHTAPAVYDPGGPVAMIDDFTVATADLWPTAGRQLLSALTAQLQRRGVVAVIAVCGRRDEPKREMLSEAGLTVASEWYVRAL